MLISPCVIRYKMMRINFSINSLTFTDLTVVELEMTLQVRQFDTESNLQRYQQALTISDLKIEVHACDGAEISSALHIASGLVRELVRDRGCCRSANDNPVMYLPDTNKRIVTLLESILVYGSAEITLHERGDIQSITEKLFMTALALGIELSNLDVRPIDKKGDSNNNKVIEVEEVVTIEDNEDEDADNDDGSFNDRSGSEISLDDSSLLDGHNPKAVISNDLASDEPVLNKNDDDDISRKTKVPLPVNVQDAPSTFEDITSERIADYDDEGLRIRHDLFEISQGRIPAETVYAEPPVSGEDTGATEANSEVYTCGICNKTFNRGAKLNQHFRACHGEDEEGSFD